LACERNYVFKYVEATIAIFEDKMFHSFAIFENRYFLKMKNCCRRRPMLNRTCICIYIYTRILGPPKAGPDRFQWRYMKQWTNSR
jgi:hypothetical protein